MTPDIYTNKEFFLEVAEDHELYVHDWGNIDATLPILYLHGGPGGASRDAYKSLFNPVKQRVIFHDQRGCGRSMPYGSRVHNTTKDLIADIEKIAKKLELTKFIITGGSWGSCLALSYALEHPKRVAALVLDGIFTGSQKEIDWLDQGVFQTSFPDVWERYLTATPKSHHDNPSTYHFTRALGEDADAAKSSAYAYESLEGGVVRLDDRFHQSDFETYDPAGIQLEIHYLVHHCFMPDRHILKNADKLTMPLYIVQGRYDMVCPAITAYELANTAPEAHLTWVIGGHVADHEGWTVKRTILEQLTQQKKVYRP